MILLSVVSFHWVLSVAVNEVVQFGFHTHTLSSSASDNNFIVTLWFNHTIYQNQFNSPSSWNTWYQAYKNTTNPRFTIIGSSHCNPESKIMFEQINGDDSLKFDIIQFYTESGDFYAIDKTYMCVDKVGTSCAPPKQIFYFDISRPNTYITDAVEMDGTSVTPRIETCSPTARPTYGPSVFPTVSPTQYPTVAPSKNPTVAPTKNPSVSPTKNPTVAPTKNPTVGTSTNPSVAPSKNPTVAPTKNPTFVPSKIPSISPIKLTSIYPTLDPTTTRSDPTLDVNDVQLRISITIKSCTDTNNEAQNCEITKEEMNTILVAYLDDEVTILRTVIKDNNVEVILLIAPSEYKQLDKDYIISGIQNDLEDEYGDVEVVITDNTDADEDKDKDNPSDLIIANLKATGLLLPSIAILLMIPLCIICALCCCYVKINRKMRHEEFMMEMEAKVSSINSVKSKSGGDTRTDGGVLSDIIADGGVKVLSDIIADAVSSAEPVVADETQAEIEINEELYEEGDTDRSGDEEAEELYENVCVTRGDTITASGHTAGEGTAGGTAAGCGDK